MEDEVALPPSLIRWVDLLQERGLGDVALLMVKMLQVWGFVGGQVLWMVAPFFGEAPLASLAETLESPEALERLRARLNEGDI